MNNHIIKYVNILIFVSVIFVISNDKDVHRSQIGYAKAINGLKNQPFVNNVELNKVFAVISYIVCVKYLYISLKNYIADKKKLKIYRMKIF